ncbi:unnamed protein product [Meganyctiphanes norvegica]|uniref:Uncharacterized protein n=1 Tax=Meganyctiphanes norvegica TaxID=48144 RepID=A0AAV2RQ12_MEGNR
MPAIQETVGAVTDVLSGALDSFGSLKSVIGGLDLTAVLTILLPVALLLLVLVVLSDVIILTVGSKRSLTTPTMFNMMKDAWVMRDEYGFSNLLESRSLEAFAPVVNGIQMAMEKYSHKD